METCLKTNKQGWLVRAGAITAACAAFAQGEVITRVAVLTGSQEVPANASPAIGCARFVIDTDANTVTYRITTSGLTAAETAAHVHGSAAPGANAGVAVALPAGNVKIGSFSYAEALEASLLNGLTYVNVHTGAFPGGEIRGQIVAAVALLDGGQEVPAVASPGSGFALFNIDPAANVLSYYIAFGGLAGVETAAHIHGMALPGTAAGVLQALPAGSPKIGTWNYTEAQELSILDGMTYVNIHTGVAPGGEIRGQIVSSINPMDGQQEVPANASPASGCVLCSFSRTAATMGYDVRYGSLVAAETAAHIHGFAPAGANAGVLTAIPAVNPKRGTWAYGAANFDSIFFNARTYANIHTAAFPGGEIRGQISGGRSIPCSPLISSNPGSVSVAAGSIVSLGVVASDRNGGALSYQWRYNGVAFANGGAVSGATSPTLTINPVGFAHAGNYDCVITNFCGTSTTTTAVLTVTGCDSIDFNGDGLFPDSADIDDFLSVFSGGPCSTGTCNDIDFNNDSLFPDSADIDSMLSVFSGGPCI